LAAGQALAAEGCAVVLAGRREEKLHRAVEAWQGPGRLVAQPVDVSVRSSVDALFAWVSSEVGDTEILVHSAGINVPERSMKDMAAEDWDRILGTIATGTYNCLRAVLPGMIRRENGLVVNISSISGIRAHELGGVAYTAAKYAQTGLGLTVAREVADRGIRVTNIYPGEVDTPILESRPAPVTAEHRAGILKPEDVASAVVFVASLPPRVHIAEMVIKPIGQMYG
jgi:NADP-dependent 3-hydroxy acid dehydrogenase YdfG